MTHQRPPSRWTSRDERVLRTLPLVRSLAYRLRPRGAAVDVEDLVSAGTIALLEAADRFDLARGVPFANFAYARIKGAIVDEKSRLCGRKGATDERPDVSLHDSVAGEPTLMLIDTIADPLSPEPPSHAEFAEIVRAIRWLPRREGKILALHTAGHSLAEIAACAACSEARASEILSRARLRLAQRVA